MKPSNKLNVYYKDDLVGTLAQADYRVAFEYADDWIEKGFAISPFSLPLEKKFLCRQNYIFKDCLVYLQIVCQMHGEIC